MADPDNANSSFEDEEQAEEARRRRGIWDPDAAFSEVERVLESLEVIPKDSVLAEELVGRFRMLSEEDVHQDSGSDDKHSDDSGMSSTADPCHSSSASSSSSTDGNGRPEVVKPVRKSRQQMAGVAEPITMQHGASGRGGRFAVYTVTRDSPAVLDSDSVAQHHLDISTEEGSILRPTLSF